MISKLEQGTSEEGRSWLSADNSVVPCWGVGSGHCRNWVIALLPPSGWNWKRILLLSFKSLAFQVLCPPISCSSLPDLEVFCLFPALLHPCRLYLYFGMLFAFAWFQVMDSCFICPDGFEKPTQNGLSLGNATQVALERPQGIS